MPRGSYANAELIAALTQLFDDNNPDQLLAILSDEFVLTVPATLPWGGTFTGPKGFADFFESMFAGQQYFDSFASRLTRLIDAEDHLVAQIVVTATGATSGKTMHIENAWIFDIADGTFVRAQLYADTAMAVITAG